MLTAPEVALGQVGVAHGHGQGRVAEELLEGRQVARRHHEWLAKGVPEIVEPEGLDLGDPAGLLECGAATPKLGAVALAEHQPRGIGSGQALKAVLLFAVDDD